MDVANFFDFRAIHGGLDLSGLDQIIADARRNTTFLAQLAKASLSMRPPIGLFNRIKQSEEGLNLKAAGLMPVVGLARVYGLECGTHERSTLGRLRVAREKGVLSAEGADLLEEGFRFLIQLRLQVQIDAVRRGQAPDNFVRLESLEKLDARHLKETLLEIRTMQQALAQRHRVELLG
jgi:CBS domain-containing protein